jgi:hypothetical protein
MQLVAVPLPCQKQPTTKGNREYSRDVPVTAELPPRSWRTCEIQPDKDAVISSTPWLYALATITASASRTTRRRVGEG